MIEKVSVAEWARRHGITRQAAHERIQKHGIAIIAGKLDVAKADAIWAASQNLMQAARRTGRAPSTANMSPLAAAQLKREQMRAEKERMQLLERKGKLVQIEAVNQYIGGMIALAKDVLLRIGPELRAKLAREKDPKKCQALVDAEVHRALGKLADYRPKIGASA